MCVYVCVTVAVATTTASVVTVGPSGIATFATASVPRTNIS